MTAGATNYYRWWRPRAAPAFRVERAAYPLLGAKGYEVPVRGAVKDGRVWVATRASHQGDPRACSTTSPRASSRRRRKRRWISSCARGGLCVRARARVTSAPASVASYRGVAGEDGHSESRTRSLFCYDIELRPRSFTRPVSTRWRASTRTVDAVLADLVRGRFKPNVAVVTVDFLVRRGFRKDGTWTGNTEAHTPSPHCDTAGSLSDSRGWHAVSGLSINTILGPVQPPLQGHPICVSPPPWRPEHSGHQLHVAVEGVV